MKRCLTALMTFVIAFGLFLTEASIPTFAQSREGVFNGHRIIIPESSIPQIGRHHTNYFFVDSDQPTPQPPPILRQPRIWLRFRLITEFRRRILR